MFDQATACVLVFFSVMFLMAFFPVRSCDAKELEGSTEGLAAEESAAIPVRPTLCMPF